MTSHLKMKESKGLIKIKMINLTSNLLKFRRGYFCLLIRKIFFTMRVFKSGMRMSGDGTLLHDSGRVQIHAPSQKGIQKYHGEKTSVVFTAILPLLRNFVPRK